MSNPWKNAVFWRDDCCDDVCETGRLLMTMIMDIKSFNNQHDCHYPVCTYMPAVSNYWPVILCCSHGSSGIREAS